MESLAELFKKLFSVKKICLIPPLLKNDQIITSFCKKANFLNSYFAKQCTPTENDSSIPTETNCLCDDKILLKYFKKAHGHDNISNCIIKFVILVL